MKLIIYFAVVLFCWSIISGFLVYAVIHDLAKPTRQYAVYELDFIPQKSKCVGVGSYVDGIYVHVNIDSNSTDFMEGEWNPNTYTIRLLDTDVDTIAHESHHATDTLYEDLYITDEHYKAYIQGKLTKCVYDLVYN